MLKSVQRFLVCSGLGGPTRSAHYKVRIFFMFERKCLVCNKTKPTEKIRNKGKSDVCQQCYDYRRNSIPHRKEYLKKYRSEHRDYFNKKHKEWRERNKKQFSVNMKFNDLKKTWVVTPKPCVVCGIEKTEAHHPDYDFPYCVVWLCHKCHGRVTNKNIRFSEISHGLIDYGSVKRLGKLTKQTPK